MTRRSPLPLWQSPAAWGLSVGVANLAWSFLSWQSRLEGARTAALLYEDCEQLAQSIWRLQSNPLPAAVISHRPLELNQLFSAALATAGIENQSLQDVSPGSLVPLSPDSPLQRQDLQVRLEPLSTPQIVQLVFALQREDRKVLVSRMSCRSLPELRSDSAEDVWEVQLTLTQLINTPISAAPSR